MEDSRRIGHHHRESVRQNQLTLSWSQGGSKGLVVSGEGGNKTEKRKRKKGKAKTQSQSKEENVNAVVKTEEKKDPPKTAKEPNPAYCFRCLSPSHQARDCNKTGDLKCEHHPESRSHLTDACNVTHSNKGLAIHPYLLLKRSSHSGARVNLEISSDFEGHIDDSITIFSDNPQSPEHTGCTVTVEDATLSEDETEYRSSVSSDEETDSEPTETLGRPYRKVLRQAKGGRKRIKC